MLTSLAISSLYSLVSHKTVEHVTPKLEAAGKLWSGFVEILWQDRVQVLYSEGKETTRGCYTPYDREGLLQAPRTATTNMNYTGSWLQRSPETHKIFSRPKLCYGPPLRHVHLRIAY